MTRNHFLLGALFCLITVVSYGIQFPIAESALKHVDPFYFTAIRYGIATIVFLVILASVEGVSAISFGGRGWKLFLYGSCGFAGYSFTVFGGQKMLGTAGTVVAAVIMALMPLITVVVNWIYKHSQPGGFALTTMGAALIGVLLVITQGNIAELASLAHSVVGDLLILAGAVMWVIYTIGGTQFRDWSPIRYTALSTLLGTITILTMTLVSTWIGWLHAPSIHTIGSIGWQMAYMIFIAGVVALFSWNAGNKIIGPTNGVLFMNVIPVTTLVVKMIQGTNFRSMELVGASIIIFALVANNLYQRTLTRNSTISVRN